MARRRRLVVAITYTVSPPRGGGQSRVFHLYRELARWFDIQLVCLAEPDCRPVTQQLGVGIVAYVIPKSAAHANAERTLSSTVGGVPLTDIAATRLIYLTPAYLAILDSLCPGADAMIASHPYLASLLVRRYPAVRFWLEAHNVEFDLKRSILPEGIPAQRLLEWVDAEERLAWRAADFVYACTRADLEALAVRYGATSAFMFEVPNGFSPDDVAYTSPGDRRALRERLGLASSPLVLFFGSWHGPNLEACERIVAYARDVPSAVFVVAGSACHAFKGRALPRNLRLLGVVDDPEKSVLLSAADLAINPMASGSGSNLKMLDYLAAGIPVLSTAFGARGLDLSAGVHFEVCTLEDFSVRIAAFVNDSPDVSARCSATARLVRERYAWPAIAESLGAKMRLRIDQPIPRPDRTSAN
jgi:glycosyltransferase involved in cell wall biosynthesis